MFKTKQLILISILCCIGIHAVGQLLTAQKEYYIKFGNGNAMSFMAFPEPKIKASVAPPTKLGTTTKATNTSVNKVNLLLKPDSLVFEPFKADDNKQIWILEFSTPTNRADRNNAYIDLKGDYNESTTYFLIKNKASGKYLTRTTKSYNNSNQVLLSPLLQNGRNENQHWVITTVEESRRGQARIFLGKTSLFGISPINSPTDLLRQYLVNDNRMAIAPGVFSTSQVNTQRYYYSFNIEPAIKAEKIILDEITTFCPKELLSGDRDFSTGTQRDLFNNIIERDKKMGMNISVTLEKNYANTEIWANVKFSASEIGGDGTATKGEWNFRVYQCINGRTIDKIISSPGAYNYFESNVNEKVFNSSHKYSSDIISYYTIIGDTMGDDVSTDDNCGDDTRVERIKFNPLFVTFNN